MISYMKEQVIGSRYWAGILVSDGFELKYNQNHCCY